MLPQGYTRVEYIESTGTQYIDTGFKPNQDTRVVLRFEPIAGTVNTTFFGTQNGSKKSTFIFLFVTTDQITRYCYNNIHADYAGLYSGVHTLDANANVWYVDGAVVHTFPAGTFQCNHNLILFAYNNAGIVRNITSSRIYESEIYNNSVLARHFIPCIAQNGEIGLYDAVSETFFGNDGTGEFIAGTVVVEPDPETPPERPEKLITDREQSDVDEAMRLIAKLSSGMLLTERERESYYAGLRGCYNATDMNRVGTEVYYIAKRLNAEGYEPRVEPKFRRSVEDIVRRDEWLRYINDARELRKNLTYYPTTPQITDDMYDGIDYHGANAIERILVDLDAIITLITRSYYYSGEVIAGEV